MRKKIPAGIIIFASLGLILTIVQTLTRLWIFGIDGLFNDILISTFVLEWSYIITITFLIRLNNWARITYIIFNIILALFAGCRLVLCTGFLGVIPEYGIYLIIMLLIFIYSIIATIYFLRSDTAKFFKQ